MRSAAIGINVHRRMPFCGFTLIELVTAIVIIGVLSAVAVPRLFDNRAFSERGYVDEVASSLRYAQRLAIASECEVSVVIGVAGYSAAQRSSLNNCDNKTGPWTTQARRMDGTPLLGAAPDGVTMSPTATIVFDIDGRVSNGNPPVFAVGPFTLAIDPNSGMVAVQP
jgi:MSHA pilin protein MshC